MRHYAKLLRAMLTALMLVVMARAAIAGPWEDAVAAYGRGDYTVAAWVAPLAISAFCLGLFVGAENTTGGRFSVPFLSHHVHSPRLAHRSVIAELRGDFERMRAQLKAVLP